MAGWVGDLASSVFWMTSDVEFFYIKATAHSKKRSQGMWLSNQPMTLKYANDPYLLEFSLVCHGPIGGGKVTIACPTHTFYGTVVRTIKYIAIFNNNNE